MTQKPVGQYALLVTAVQNAYRTTTQKKYVHLVTFRDDNGQAYIAEEVEDNPVSRFVKNMKNVFEVKSTGRNGNMDWIRYISSDVDRPVSVSREDLIVAQTAFNGAVQLGVLNKWTNDEVITNAYTFAGNIKRIAKFIGMEESL